MVLGAESHASRDVAIDMVDTSTNQQLQLIDEQVPTLDWGEWTLNPLGPNRVDSV